MAKTTKSPISSRTRSKKSTAITKKKNIFAVTVNLVRLSLSQIEAAIASNSTTTPKYNLRKRIKNDTQAKSTKNVGKKRAAVSAAVSTAVCTRDHMPANRLWAVLRKDRDFTIEKDLYCLAKMRSYSPWPAMVLQQNGQKSEVYFFGEGTTGKCFQQKSFLFTSAQLWSKNIFIWMDTCVQYESWK